MARRRTRLRYRFDRLLPAGLFATLVSVLLATGSAHAGDVASAEARGEVGVGASEGDAAVVLEAPRLSADGGEGTPWLEVLAYLVVSALILAGYAIAASKLPWLRPRSRPKP